MKKDIPLEVHEFVEPYLDKNGKNYLSIDPKKFMLRFIDNDENSDFYFNVEEYKIDTVLQVLIDCKPINKQSVSNRKKWIKATNLQVELKNWIELLEGYDKVNTVFDDPILKQYQKEFMDEFILIEDDANKISFDLSTQYWLDEYCNSMSIRLGELKSDENTTVIEEIQKEIQELKHSQSSLTKNHVITKLSSIWAKSRKMGLNFLTEIFTKAKEGIVNNLKQLIIENE